MEHRRKNLKFSGRNLFHYHFVDYQFYIDHPGIKTRPPQWETVIICVSRGHLQFETLLDLIQVIWYTPSTLEMPAEKHVGLCSCILFPQKLDYSDKFLFQLQIRGSLFSASWVVTWWWTDKMWQTYFACFHCRWAPEFGVLWEVWFVVTFNVFLRVVSWIEVVLIYVFVVNIFSHYV